jgi:NAD(P)-dependent dehydrogenase (short-subunit alcohol dehydrogenase family)
MENAQADIALVTGSNQGIGFEIARGLATKKIKVLVGSRDESRGQRAAERIRETGGNAHFLKLDVTKCDSVQQAAEWIETNLGRLDILVNNAGIGEQFSTPSTAPLDHLREIYETNVFGAIAVTQAMLPLLRRSKRGRVVNVSSSLGSLTLASQQDSALSELLALGYNTSKTALNSVTIQFANELRQSAIKVNAVCPGYCATAMSGYQGPRTPRQGASVAIRYATIADDGPTGGYFHEGGPIPW